MSYRQAYRRRSLRRAIARHAARVADTCLAAGLACSVGGAFAALAGDDPSGAALATLAFLAGAPLAALAGALAER